MGFCRVALQFLAFVTCPLQQPSLNEMRQQIESGEAILLDVRSTQEWTDGHVEFALHVPVTELDEGRLPIGLPEDKILYVHCQTGRRSTRAAWILREQFPCVVNVTYNIDDYRAAGWPIR